MPIDFQYPDTATFSVNVDGGIDPGTGYPLPQVPKMFELTGRYESKIGDFLKRVPDASSFNPVFVFYMPLEQENIPIGSELIVKDYSSGIEFRGIVQMFNKGMFNAFAVCSK